MRITSRTRRAPPDPHADWYARVITAVITDGSYKSLLPLPIDGVVLVPSRSVEDADHEILLRGRRVVRCTGPCQGHATCWHRVSAAVAAWAEEHPGWDISLVCDSQGRPHTALIRQLIREYLEPEPRRGTPWTARLDATQPETRSEERFTLPLGGL